MSPIPSIVLLQIALLSIAVLPFATNVVYTKGELVLRKSESYKNCIILLFWIFCIFATYDGDWYHYYDIIKEFGHNPTGYTHMEDFHIWIITNITGTNYIFWRGLIWGTTIIFLKLGLRNLGCDNLQTWSCFVLTSLIQISMGRVYLGSTILLYGFSLIVTSQGKFGKKIWGVVWMGSSLFIHKSIFMYLVTAIPALWFYRKWFFVIIICSFPLIVAAFKSLLTAYLLQGNADHTVELYLEQATAVRGIGISLYNNIQLSLQYIVLGLSFLFLRKSNSYGTPLGNVWEWCFNQCGMYLIIFLSLTFNQIGSAYLAERALVQNYILLPILFGMMLKHGYKLKTNVAIFILFYICDIYRLLYAYYLQRSGSGV